MRVPRPRFNLKTLFVAVTLSAVAAWLWNLYPFVSVNAANISTGQKVVVRGRFVDLFGPSEIPMDVELGILKADGTSGSWGFETPKAQRTGIGLYHFDCELGPVYERGEYELSIFVFAPALPQRWHKCIATRHVSVGL